MTWRRSSASCSAAAAAALGALILGEYEFTGTLPWVAGPLFGLVIGEVVVGVGRSRHPSVAGVVAGPVRSRASRGRGGSTRPRASSR